MLASAADDETSQTFEELDLGFPLVVTNSPIDESCKEEDLVINSSPISGLMGTTWLPRTSSTKDESFIAPKPVIKLKPTSQSAPTTPKLVKPSRPPLKPVLEANSEAKKQKEKKVPEFFLGAPPDQSSIVMSDAATTSSVSCLMNLAKVKINNKLTWKARIKEACNFDLFAPGLITMLGFDGIELWAMDPKNGDVVNIADTVRDEYLLKWSWDSNSWKLAAGKGMIGRVFLTGVAEWADNIATVGNDKFLRCPTAQKIGVKGVGVVPSYAPTGDKVIVFLYSRKELGFDKDKGRQQFIEDLIGQWMQNGKGSVKFHSSKKSLVSSVVKAAREEKQKAIAGRGQYVTKPAMPIKRIRQKRRR
ncbi:hypothetical protein AAMO2058_001313300 [Amorphochlora amoebiformis]|eukprot:1391916-Amorphochlora_amoeboformis.AAC.2